MYKQKGKHLNKKPTCRKMYQRVPLAGRGRKIEKEQAVRHSREMQKSFEPANKIKTNVKKA